MKKTIILLAMATLWPFLSTKAQENLIAGTVKEINKKPLPAVTIQQKGTSNSTQTDTNGNFTLKTTSPNGSISVTHMGYLSRTVEFSGATKLEITLYQQQETLRQVEVNTGYYSVKQRNLTGSISSIKAEEIEKQPVTNLLSSLQGRITGAYIQQTSSTPGGNINITIRGRNGIDASSNPLYLVDGVPFGGTTLSNSLSVAGNVYTTGGSSPLNTISPDDIASIEILKDADATAIYGSRGANGVVLITTKKGKSGKTSVDFSAQSGYSTPTRGIDMLRTEDYLALRKLAIALDGTTIKPTDHDLNGKWDQNAYTDFQKQLIGNNAPFSSYKASISGGSQTSSFLLSATHNTQGTIYKSNLGYDRTGIHLSASHSSPDNKLKASASAIYSSDQTNWVNADLTPRALNLAPNSPALENPDGSINWAGSTWVNPLRSFEQGYRARNTNLTASASLSYLPLKNLEIKTNLGYSALALTDRSYTPVSYYDPSEGRTSATSTSDYGNSRQQGWSSEFQGSYHTKINTGTLSLLIGATLQQQSREALYLRGTGFASDALIANIQSASNTQVRGGSNSEYRYGGIYGRINYALKEKYILNLTARRDGSSRFGTENRFGNFGAIGAAYVFSEEGLIKNSLPELSFGKLRFSYGTSGNDQIGDYEYLDTYQPATGYNSSTGLSPVRLFNPDFGWEKNRKLEVGLDLGFFRDRLTATIGYYRNNSSSQLIDYPLSSLTGFTSIRANLAALVRNIGWEFQLTSRNLSSGKLKWTTSFNMTVPKNTLVQFPGLAASSYANTYVIGSSLNVVKLLELKGVDPTTGVYTFTDFNGDGTINALDRQITGDRRQKFYGGLDNTISYGNFELGVLFQFVSQIAGSFRSQYTVMPGTAFNQPLAYQGKYWTKPGDIAELQRPSTGLNTDALIALSNYQISDAVLTDASFIRLKNISLSYRTGKLLKGKTIRGFLQAQNLWTITNYFGLDPESTNSTLPPLRTITLGLSLTL
jgi:TonB-linked SusC/RagA family outer membrane protein